MKRLLLIGAGHAHAQVLRDLCTRASSDLEVTLVSPASLAPYSGMVPGWMAGHYDWDECCIDAEQLCRAAGARFVRGLASAIDADARTVQLADGARLPYDLLSLDIGSTALPLAGAGTPLVAMRPLERLEAHWERLRHQVQALPAGARLRVVMVGAGAAGIEALLAVRHQLAAWAPAVGLDCVLATSGAGLLPALAARAARLVQRHLRAHDIEVVRGFEAAEVDAMGVRGCDGRRLDADVVLWATGAAPHAWPGAAGLALDEAGFIRVDATLRSVSHPDIFAAGDCAGLPAPVPKAGVFAVRMGPVLAHNLHAALHELPLAPYRPQRRNLFLLGTGARHAIAAWGPFAWQGKWVWRWKERIDRRFLARYNGGPRPA
ncbi:FAD-dependent oxidoreductase [Massilia sp. H6]|uniref:FAD-dependent oxidoreductase n=1 Tax=Massilia sp. H6 TaxID=2970464 RepID=UPI0021676786|nr:FAD-dependent oxidoreductase [Massilia sp. H6]UVW30043.1 FAD-dependent oxidoreductase [Massilia sp. H6]